jgi:hypothetical protein
MVNSAKLKGRDRLRGHDHKRILTRGLRFLPLEWTGQNNMYRVIAIVGGGLALAACSSTPDWMSLDALKPAPVLDTVRFESTPPGADAKTSNGQTCRTPCALALPTNAPLTVTFTLNGYQPESADLDPVSSGSGVPELHPNPVQVDLVPAAPPPKPVKPARRRVSSAKPAAKPKPKTTAAPAPAQPAASMQQQQAPWPATPPRQ